MTGAENKAAQRDAASDAATSPAAKASPHEGER